MAEILPIRFCSGSGPSSPSLLGELSRRFAVELAVQNFVVQQERAGRVLGGPSFRRRVVELGACETLRRSCLRA